MNEKKILKFRTNLADLILKGEKSLTWRLFDDKDLKMGDEIDMINWDTGKKFGESKLLKVWEKKMAELSDEDLDGHEQFASDEEMYDTYKKYYGDRVGPETVVKVIRFEMK